MKKWLVLIYEIIPHASATVIASYCLLASSEADCCEFAYKHMREINGDEVIYQLY